MDHEVIQNRLHFGRCEFCSVTACLQRQTLVQRELSFLEELWTRKQVRLWDYNDEEVNSVTIKFTRKLRQRFGGTSQPDTYRTEAK